MKKDSGPLIFKVFNNISNFRHQFTGPLSRKNVHSISGYLLLLTTFVALVWAKHQLYFPLWNIANNAFAV